MTRFNLSLVLANVLANIQAERCLAVGAVETAVSSQEEMSKNGRAGFRLRNHLGKQGKRGFSAGATMCVILLAVGRKAMK